MINNLEKELRHGKMVKDMRVNMLMAKKMDREILFGVIHHHIQGILLTIISMGLVYIRGKMVDNIKESGNKIKCMEMAYLHGKMGRSTKGNIRMTKKKVTEFLPGVTASNTRVNGKKG